MQQHESPRELLAEIETIAPILVGQALESEKLGRLDDATWDALRKTRLLRFLCPRELGGDEAWSLHEHMSGPVGAVSLPQGSDQSFARNASNDTIAIGKASMVPVPQPVVL